jgi:hypothetical protein
MIFRTHVWDGDIADMARRSHASAPTARFVVAADETRGPLDVAPFAKLAHTDAPPHADLPAMPVDRVLWWNADYVLYAARQAFPDHDYYVMLEYDVFLNCDVDALVARCADARIDLAAHQIQPIAAGTHWSHATIAEVAAAPFWALIPFIVVSARAVDLLLQTRLAHAAMLREGRIAQWPYCETFLPSVVAASPDMQVASLDRFADTALLRFRPFLSLHDPRLRAAGRIAHPVLSGERFLRAFLADEPAGSHVMTSGQLRPELRFQDPAVLRAVIGDEAMAPDTARAQPPAGLRGDCVDLARGRPALQSTHSPWSRGATAAEDAARAVSGELAEDYAFHTAAELDPWWQVDLQECCVIAAVEIINRVAVPHKFKHFRIEASPDGTAWTTYFSKTDGAMVSADAAEPALFTLPNPVCARYLRVVQLGADVMHLRRVRVLGIPLPPAIAAAPGPAPAAVPLDPAVLLAQPGDRAAFSRRGGPT